MAMEHLPLFYLWAAPPPSPPLPLCCQESCLAGRAVLVGYPGWLDSHGMPYHGRYNAVLSLLRGVADGRATLLDLNATHIVLDVQELARDEVDVTAINGLAYRVASNGRCG